MQMGAHDRAKGWSVTLHPMRKHGALLTAPPQLQDQATDAARPPRRDGLRWRVLIGNAYPSEASGPLMNFPTTERTQSIMYKSAMPIGIIRKAGTHLVVHGTNKISGT